jgi:VanZ family protein
MSLQEDPGYTNPIRLSVVQVAKSSAALPLIKACSHCQRRVGFAIGITSNQWLSNRVWFVDAVPRMLIICALPNPRHSAARSVMSSRFPSVADTIARCIGAVMKPRGGRRLASIRPPRLASFG